MDLTPIEQDIPAIIAAATNATTASSAATSSAATTTLSRRPVSDPEYKLKLEMSYLLCIKELCRTDLPIGTTDITPEVDDITTDGFVHSYIFRRSHFYNSFIRSNNKTSRLKRDLIAFWSSKNRFVDVLSPTPGKFELILNDKTDQTR